MRYNEEVKFLYFVSKDRKVKRDNNIEIPEEGREVDLRYKKKSNCGIKNKGKKEMRHEKRKNPTRTKWMYHE